MQEGMSALPPIATAKADIAQPVMFVLHIAADQGISGKRLTSVSCEALGTSAGALTVGFNKATMRREIARCAALKAGPLVRIMRAIYL